jgi:bacterioferritin-associated ferredoxin
MMACLCEGVSERRVRREIEQGATSIDDLATGCGAGARCCGCHPTLDALLAEHVTAVTTVAVPRRRLSVA